MPIRKLLLIAAITLATAAHAELKGSYQLQKGRQLDLYYLDDQHMRANLADKNQLVLKDSQSWVLHRQGEQWLAMDADQAGALLKAAHPEAANTEIGKVELRDTGRKETVAGYPGKVYELSAGENKYELVLTDNPEVLALTNGWRKLALKLSRNLGAEQSAQLQQALSKLPERGMGGLLRQGDQLKLVAIDRNVGRADVDFPANTQVLPKLQIPGIN